MDSSKGKSCGCNHSHKEGDKPCGGNSGQKPNGNPYNPGSQKPQQSNPQPGWQKPQQPTPQPGEQKPQQKSWNHSPNCTCDKCK